MAYRVVFLQKLYFKIKKSELCNLHRSLITKYGVKQLSVPRSDRAILSDGCIGDGSGSWI